MEPNCSSPIVILLDPSLKDPFQNIHSSLWHQLYPPPHNYYIDVYSSSVVVSVAEGHAIMTFHFLRSLASTNISAVLLPSQADIPSCIYNLWRLLLRSPSIFPLMCITYIRPHVGLSTQHDNTRWEQTVSAIVSLWIANKATDCHHCIVARCYNICQLKTAFVQFFVLECCNQIHFWKAQTFLSSKTNVANWTEILLVANLVFKMDTL